MFVTQNQQIALEAMLEGFCSCSQGESKIYILFVETRYDSLGFGRSLLAQIRAYQRSIKYRSVNEAWERDWHVFSLFLIK